MSLDRGGRGGVCCAAMSMHDQKTVAIVGGSVVAEEEIMFGTHVTASRKKFIYLVQNEHALDLSQLYARASFPQFFFVTI